MATTGTESIIASVNGVTMDCPHRERLGWLEEYHLNGPSLRYDLDLARLFTRARELCGETDYVVLGSLAGYWSGEFTNSFILAKMKLLTNGRWLWTRTIGSTIFGEMVDTAVFVAVASLFGVFPWSLFLTLTVTNYWFKVGVEALMTPVTYLIVNALKKAESEDYYDRNTDFNPFIVGR